MSKLIRVAIEENHKSTIIHLVDMFGSYTRAKNHRMQLVKL